MQQCYGQLKKGILFALTLFLLSGCVDLAVNNGKNKQKILNNTPLKGEVYTMRGGLGGVFSKGMNHLEDRLQNNYKIPSESTVWYKANALSQAIIKQYKEKNKRGPIILVGHSLGANEQIKVAKNLAQANIPVALLITVDAVSPIRVPPNVKQAINIYKPSFVPMFSGLKLKAVNEKVTHIENINVNTLKNAHVNHFTIDKDQSVQDIMVDNILAALHAKDKKHIA
jgi:thioesterase domain-containing protein